MVNLTPYFAGITVNLNIYAMQRTQYNYQIRHTQLNSFSFHKSYVVTCNNIPTVFSGIVA